MTKTSENLLTYKFEPVQGSVAYCFLFSQGDLEIFVAELCKHSAVLQHFMVARSGVMNTLCLFTVHVL